ncbi:VirB4 family type IV secretion system protein [Clostridioides difficile]
MNKLIKINKNKKEYNPYFLKAIQPQGGIRFSTRIIEKGDGFETCLHVYGYPKQNDTFWLEKLFSFRNVITTLDVKTEKKEKTLTKMNKSLSEYNHRFYEDRDIVSKIEAQSAYDTLYGLVEDITNFGEVMKSIHVRYYISDKTIEGVENRVAEISKELEGIGFRTAICLSEQTEEWMSLFYKYEKQQSFRNKRKGKPLQALTLAGGYPFRFTSLNDKTGCYLGQTFTGGDIIFDPFTNDGKKRIFYNSVVVGLMGQGKSTLLKELSHNNTIVGNTTRVIDVTGEFEESVRAEGGKTVSLDGTDGIINPLEVFATITDKHTYKVNNEMSFTTHLDKVSTIYKFLVPECSASEQREFEKLLSEFYVYHGIEKEKSTEYETEKYPIVEDLLSYVEKQMYDDVANKIPKKNITLNRQEKLENIILNLESIVRDYGKLFNGHSSIADITNEQVVSFELRNLTQFDERIFNAQIFSVLNLLWNEALVQGRREKDKFDKNNKDQTKTFDSSIEEAKKFFLIIDEAHRIINSNNIKAVKFLTDFEREARKYFAGMIFASQNIKDFVPEDVTGEVFQEIKKLFALTQYKFIMRQDHSDKEVFNKVFEGQLSESELAQIANLSKRECLLSISGQENIFFEIDISKYELDLFAGGA